MSKFENIGLDVEKITKMIIMDPRNPSVPLRDKEGREAYIEGHGSDSEAAQKINRSIATARLSMRNRNKITGERIESERIELLAGLVTGWYLVGFDGEPLDVEPTEQNVRTLFAANRMIWLRDQWDEHTADRANFVTA